MEWIIGILIVLFFLSFIQFVYNLVRIPRQILHSNTELEKKLDKVIELLEEKRSDPPPPPPDDKQPENE
ncbi:DUF4083 family protein [Staphylospora marina]|uniref:DUF4083 family protein n=1 Tax=Staphylospora marina TaxID=2490858 RepID=UPI001F154A5D|nr:DUF4083 family protein [Staphylospora marina]